MCGAAAKNAFNAFDKKSEERIKVGDIEATMKKLGHSIKSGWLEKIESTIDTEGSSHIPLGWRFSAVVASFVARTKLLNVEPG